MIFKPRNWAERELIEQFMFANAGVIPSKTSHLLGWQDEDGEILVGVCLDSFLGKTCQIHLAMREDFHFSPRGMLFSTFEYVFDILKVELLLGVVNSKNHKAMYYDLHLGFKELFRMPGVHEDGGDIVILGMTRDKCIFINRKNPETVAA
jgi:hypothetical protein